jgi:hypothetical protein
VTWRYRANHERERIFPTKELGVCRFDMLRSAEYARVEWRGVTAWEAETI